MGKKSDNDQGGYKFKYKRIIVIMFIIVLGVILYSSVFNSNWSNIEITGDFLNSESNTSEISDISIKANLSDVSLELDGVFKEVSFTSVGDNKIKIEKSSPSLDDSSKIVLKNYDGKIVLSSDKIVSLKGDADEILLDEGRVFYEEESDVELSNFDYKDLQIDDVYIKKFEKFVSGIINVDGTYSSLESNELLIRKFQGTVSSNGLNESINLIGEAQGVKSKNIKAGSLGLFS